jgi:ribonuclease P protein component
MAGRSEQGLGFGALDRLHRPDEFAVVMASRLRVSGGCFELRYRNRQQAGAIGPTGKARLGLIIPKRLAKRAVLRNLLKRLAREAFRKANLGLPAVDVVLRLVKPPLPAGQNVDPVLRRSWRRSMDELLAGVGR